MKAYTDLEQSKKLAETLDSSDNHRYRFRCMERYTEWYDNAIDAWWL